MATARRDVRARGPVLLPNEVRRLAKIWSSGLARHQDDPRTRAPRCRRKETKESQNSRSTLQIKRALRKGSLKMKVLQQTITEVRTPDDRNDKNLPKLTLLTVRTRTEGSSGNLKLKPLL